MKYYDKLIMASRRASLEQVVLTWPAVSTRQMFGCPAYKAGEHLFAFLVTDGLVLTRLPEGPKVTQELNPQPFQAGGRTMKSWCRLSLRDEADLRPILPLLEVSYSAALETTAKPQGRRTGGG